MAYNGLNQRAFHHDVWGGNHSLQYDGTSPGAALLSDSNGSSVYTPGIGQTVNGVTLYTNVDALGSVHDTQTDGSGTQDVRRYDAFGLLVASQGSHISVLGFAGAAGYQTDTDTGLMLLGNRYYDPSIGRFLSPDKVHDGDNWYAYCDNDPTGELDPEGLDATPDPTKKPPFSPDPNAFGPGTGLTYLGETTNADGTPCYNYLVGLAVQEQNVSIGNGTPGGGGNSFAGRIGDAVDGYVTGGLVGKAGTAMGMADAGQGSRRNAVGLTVAAVGLGLAFAITEGKDKEVIAEANAGRGLWEMTEAGTSQVLKHSKFGKFYQHTSTGLWWTRDLAGHGGSVWKVYQKIDNALVHYKDADEFGDFLNKYKGPIGRIIPLSQFSGSVF